jgi:hypothetical protein
VAQSPLPQSVAAWFCGRFDGYELIQTNLGVAMQKGLRGGKRTLVKRSSSVNLYADQAIQIQAIMESVGARKEAPVIRDLLDEALAARRRKSVHQAEAEPPPPAQDVGETLQTIQTLLLKLIRQGETGLRAVDISLILQQEIFAVASADKKIAWNRLEAPALSEGGMTAKEIEAQLRIETNEAKDHAYGVAEEIRKRQDKQAGQNCRRHVPQLSFEST